MAIAEVDMKRAKGGQGRPKRPLSRVTSDASRGLTGWLDGNDRRGPVARRFRDLCTQLTNDLGGPSQLSEGQRQIIRRVASLSVWCESAEAKMADGQEVDIDRFQRASNSMRRLVESLAIDRGRLTKDITASIYDLYRERPDVE
jgi:hypothetical protein